MRQTFYNKIFPGSLKLEWLKEQLHVNYHLSVLIGIMVYKMPLIFKEIFTVAIRGVSDTTESTLTMTALIPWYAWQIWHCLRQCWYCFSAVRCIWISALSETRQIFRIFLEHHWSKRHRSYKIFGVSDIGCTGFASNLFSLQSEKS